MPDPVTHLLAGPNGAGKTTFYAKVVEPATHLPFVNADLLAAERWPEDPETHAYEASRLAALQRAALIERRESFVTETVFSHNSKSEFLRAATQAGYLIHLHIVAVPEALAVARVADRTRRGGHTVPEHKIRDRYGRLWPLVAEAARHVDQATVYDNSNARSPFRKVAEFARGTLVGPCTWPTWAPESLRALTR